MSNIDFLLTSGCSFTEGGGMDSPTMMRELGYDIPENYTNTKYLRDEFRWSNVVGNHFGCESVNLSISGHANDFIRRGIIKYIEENKEKLSKFKNKVCIVQASFPHRFNFEYDEQPQPYAFTPQHKPPFHDKEYANELETFYKIYLKHIFDSKRFTEYYYYEVLSLFSYLKENGFHSYIIFYDDEFKSIESKLHNIIKFDGENLQHFTAETYKERFCDVIDWTGDTHFTPNGNKLIANEIIRFLNDKNIF